MTDTKQSRQKVESLLETIESEGWMVQSYDADVDPHRVETPNAMIQVEYIGTHE